MKKDDKNISEMIAPMFAITMELDVIISTLLRDKFNMSLADFKVLRAIYMLDASTQLDIARYNHVSEAAVSKRVNSLADDSLIKKCASPDDKRKSILSLTSKGKALMKQLQIAVIGNIESILVDFSESNQKLTKELLTEILVMIVKKSPNKTVLLKSKHPVLQRLKGCQVNKS